MYHILSLQSTPTIFLNSVSHATYYPNSSEFELLLSQFFCLYVICTCLYETSIYIYVRNNGKTDGLLESSGVKKEGWYGICWITDAALIGWSAF